ncbi:MAG: PQQ-binding-like beta-propeller repeat protein [Bryobacteraceae bacterium]
MRRAFALLFLTALLRADDWPEWRGAGRRGEWRESGILETFPAGGLKVRWRTPVRGGFSGPAVAAGRVYLTDYQAARGPRGVERTLCLDEQTGKTLWAQEWVADYTGLMTLYAIGPRATPTVDGDRVYVQGGGGALACLNAKTGEVVWKKDHRKDYGLEMPVWGTVAAPLVDGDRLIAVIGGRPDAKVVAFDKKTGKELWRALSSEKSEPGYAPPLLIEAGGARQLIIWHPEAIASLNPETGRVLWQQPFTVRMGMTIATPVHSGARLLVSSFYSGPMMLALDEREPRARMLWKGASDSEIETDKLHSITSTPVLAGDYVYGVDSYGQMRCLNARTGERIWESQVATGEKARWATAFFVRQGDRYFINNDRGDLIIARLSPEGYKEISRTRLIKPTSNSGNRREAGAVHWSHPAYANRHIYVRNDEEILAASLEKTP